MFDNSFAESLSNSEWHEIWNCCEENIQEKLPVDGFDPTQEQINSLTEVDWIQIYLSVETKHDACKNGFYGHDRVAREWRDELAFILDVLDSIKAEYIGGEHAN